MSATMFVDVDPCELSRMARRGYGCAGQGLVLLVYGAPDLAPQAVYLSGSEVQDYLGARSELLHRVEDALRSYDPEEEFVLVEVGREDEPILRVMKLQ